ncbi:MAG: hypothetical protein ACD_34C00463G0001 [uncultured bacterium]|nr:MAG: hypothetical protein ACD_34C00463G0001 [uncultured bacterium]
MLVPLTSADMVAVSSGANSYEVEVTSPIVISPLPGASTVAPVSGAEAAIASLKSWVEVPLTGFRTLKSTESELMSLPI